MLDVKDEMFVAGATAAASGNVIDETESEQPHPPSRRARAHAGARRAACSPRSRRTTTSPIKTGATVDYVACPSCNTPHPRTAAPSDLSAVRDRRSSCGCPADGCGTRNDATAARCSKCGADLHRYTEATRRLATLPAALSDGRVAAAAGELAEITRVLGDSAVPGDLRRRIEEAESRARAQWDAIETAIGARRLFAARTGLRGLQKTARDVIGPSGDVPAIRAKEVERRLSELDDVLARARAASGAARERALVQAHRAGGGLRGGDGGPRRDRARACRRRPGRDGAPRAPC